jgi:hypothetical protein
VNRLPPPAADVHKVIPKASLPPALGISKLGPPKVNNNLGMKFNKTQQLTGISRNIVAPQQQIAGGGLTHQNSQVMLRVGTPMSGLGTRAGSQQANKRNFNVMKSLNDAEPLSTEDDALLHSASALELHPLGGT